MAIGTSDGGYHEDEVAYALSKLQPQNVQPQQDLNSLFDELTNEPAPTDANGNTIDGI